jgi:uncharacterized membrane protein
VPLLVRWIHVLSAITWIGGMLFIALVLVPITRKLQDPALRAHLVQEVGVRFRTIGWIALGLMLLTGLGNLVYRPYLLHASRFHWKLGLVLLALVVSALHDFVLGPRAGQPGADPSARVRASWVARINALLALAIVLLGLSLRG